MAEQEEETVETGICYGYPNNFTGRWKAFVTLTDWSGPVMRDSWYGHGKTWNLIAKYFLLSTIFSTIVLTFQVLQNWPILSPYLTVQEMDRMQQSHGECLQEICQAVEHIEFDCQMLSNGRVVMSPVPFDRIPLPSECHNAIRLTFGETFEYDLLNKPDLEATDDSTTLRPHSTTGRQIDLMHFQELTTGEDARNANIPIFQVVSDACMVQYRVLDFLISDQSYSGAASSATMLMEPVDLFAMLPGDHEERIRLRNFACPKHMTSHARDIVMQDFKKIYQFFLTWPRSVGLCFIFLLNMIYYSSACISRIYFLFLPSFILWLLLPKDEFRGRRISYFSTISTLLLLYTLIDESRLGPDQMICAAILGIAALSLNNKRAAMEWSFLFLLSYVDVGRQGGTWWKHPVLLALHQFDPSGKVIPGLIVVISYLFPGYGSWKLVFVYMLYMSYPRKQRRGEHHIKQD